MPDAMKASHQVWITVLLLAPIYGAGCTFALAGALMNGLPEGVVLLGPGDLGWRYVYAAQLAAVLTLGPVTIGLANLKHSLRRSIEALVVTAVLMQVITWWMVTSPLPHFLTELAEGLPGGFEGFSLDATGTMKLQADRAALLAWLAGSGLLPFTLARDDLRAGALGYGAAVLFSVVPAVLLTPPDVISTVLVMGPNLAVATLGLVLGAALGRVRSRAPDDKA